MINSRDTSEAVFEKTSTPVIQELENPIKEIEKLVSEAELPYPEAREINE